MEKRRRARINNCLNDLKTLILDAMKKDVSILIFNQYQISKTKCLKFQVKISFHYSRIKICFLTTWLMSNKNFGFVYLQPARHSKLEKADILEMTVKHLETLQRQQVALAAATDPNILNKFRAGFTECASEVGRFPGLDASVKRRLMAHLASCLGPVESTTNTSGQTTTGQQVVQPSAPTTQLQVHILPQVDSTPRIQVQQSNGIFFTNANGTGLQLVPTRLPNGDIALVLPAGAKATPVTSPSSSPAPPSPLPTLIPIPQRTASTASASSSASSTASSTSTSAASPVAFEAPPAAYRAQSPVYTTSHRDVATSPANGYTSDPEFDPRVYSPPLQKPLALVMRRSVLPPIEGKPWRPW